MKLIHRKAKAGEINRIPEGVEAKPRRAPGAKGIDLAALLASSLKQGQRSANRTSHDDEEPLSRRLAKTRGGTRRKSGRGEHHKKSA